MSEDLQFDREEFAKLKRQTWDATNYGSWFKPARGQVIDTLEKSALKKALAGRTYEKGLDVGIGNGRLLPIYAPHVARVTGMDISAEQLERATQAARELGVPFSTVLCQEASRIEVDDASFDLIICQAAFKNFSQPGQVIDEMYRVLRGGGMAVIQDMWKEASDATIREEVNPMRLSPMNAFMTRRALGMLRRRAYTKEQFERSVSVFLNLGEKYTLSRGKKGIWGGKSRQTSETSPPEQDRWTETVISVINVISW